MNELQLKNRKDIKIGINSALYLKTNVHVANNCPIFIIQKLINLKIEYQTLNVNNEDLGKLLARNHNVAVISI